MGMSGADVDALDRVGVQLEKASKGFRRKGAGLSSALDAAPWKGQKAERFRRDFHSVHMRSINDAAQFLDNAYETLRRNSDEQRSASGLGQRGWRNELGIWFRRRFSLPEFHGWGNVWRHPFLPFRPLLPRWPFLPGLDRWRSLRLPNFRIPPWSVPFAPFPWIGGLGLGIIMLKTLEQAGGGQSSAPTNSGGSGRPAPQPTPPSQPKSPSSTAPAPVATGQGATLPPGRGAEAIPSWFKPNDNPDYAYQCTDWVRRRRENLGFGPTALVNGRWGNGAEMAGMNGGSVSTPPSFGAIASYGTGYGHVMIVEEVMDGGNRIRVSEMNVGDKNYEVGTPAEFRSDTILERRNGQWFNHRSGRLVGQITFAK